MTNILDNPDTVPAEVAEVLNTFDDSADPYAECERICKELALIGYSAEFGLDGVITEITKN